MPKIFISYRRDDSVDVTGRIYDRLEPHFGRDNVFLDIDTIPFGVDFREHLDQAVGQCDVLLAVIGVQWLDIRHPQGAKGGRRRLDDPADFVRIEILSALERKIPVIPVLVGRALMPGEEELPEGLRALAYRNAAEVRSGRDFRDHVDRLIRGIEHVIEKVQGKSAGGTQQLREPLKVSQPVEQRPVEARRESPREFTNSIGMKFVLIPAGTFRMGSPDSEKERSADEGPVHEVQITRPFYMGVTPVTQEQYEKVMGNNPSHFSAKGDGKDKVRGMDTRAFPVEQVSWEEAVEFSKRLAALAEEAKSGRAYRLPTEAEWEYSCRGGASSYQIFHFGNTLSSKQANFDGNYPYGGAAKGDYLERTCKVASYPANGFGLYDMHGNVWEWCADRYDENYYASSPRQDPQGPESASARVLRGGGWFSLGGRCRSAYRRRFGPGERNLHYGFRLAAVPSLEQSK